MEDSKYVVRFRIPKNTTTEEDGKSVKQRRKKITVLLKKLYNVYTC